MSVARCWFPTVPDPSRQHPDRLVTCGRRSDEHPVTGEGRFVNHRRAIVNEPTVEVVREADVPPDGQIQHLSRVSSEDRMHVLDQDCWCEPTVEVVEGRKHVRHDR